jgi:RimJ/RimL family protein N-acetyltransferase
VTHALWPLFDLCLRTPRLELRLPTDDELAELAAVARAGIHDPVEMPFAAPWTDVPSPEVERSFAQFQWRARATWQPDSWVLPLMVLAAGRPVGVQALIADRFVVLRTVSSGSWLGRAHQGQGIGREMRVAVLALAFDGLGAEVATTEALSRDGASAGVSRSVGYAENGSGRLAPRGSPVDTVRFRLDRAGWAAHRAASRAAGRFIPVAIEGLEECRGMFGAENCAASRSVGVQTA